jgi:RNA polymerase sigma-70 factor (ECF subfamily)
MIQRGLFHLNRSAAGEEISEFHLQAGIAYCHCTAATYEATDWPRILSLYDLLVGINPSPVIALNRAVAISRVRGPEAAIEALEAIRPRDALENYYLFHAALAQFQLETGETEQAARRFLRALELTGVKSEQAFLARKLEECETRQAG